MRTALESGTPVEVARPADGRQATRGLVVIPDIGGLRPLFDEHAQRMRLKSDDGLAAVHGLLFPGVDAVAAPAFAADGTIAAVVTSLGASTTFDASVGGRLADEVRAAARRISAALGAAEQPLSR